MKKSLNILYIIPMCMIFSCNAEPLEPGVAIANARTACAGISETFKSMKTMAQVNTAITSVGTAAGAGATIVGIAKANIDKELDELIKAVKNREGEYGSTTMTLDQTQDFVEQTTSLIGSTTASAVEDREKALEKQSKNLGNWRTGLLAGNTATNIAATVIAANNRTDQSLRDQLDKCNSAIHDLQISKMQAHANNADVSVTQQMDRIIDACRDYDTLDISQIDTKAKNAAISSGVGAGVGLAGTVTSAIANTDKIRHDNSDAGMAKEKNLNNASNVLAAGATVASGVATVFNAQQISTLNRAQQIATKCSEALNQ